MLYPEIAENWNITSNNISEELRSKIIELKENAEQVDRANQSTADADSVGSS